MEERKSGKKVPQLGEHEVQSIHPLKEFPDKYNDSTGLSGAPQVIGDSRYPIADEIAWKYVYESLWSDLSRSRI